MTEKEKAVQAAPPLEVGDEEDLFRRVLMMEEELRSIKAAMQAFPSALE